MITLIKESRLTCSQAYHSDYSVTEPTNYYVTDHFHFFLAMKVDLNPANLGAEDS